MVSVVDLFTLRDVYRARVVVQRHLIRTPLRYSRRLSRLLGFNVYLKLENAQVTGSFKVRGGVYFMSVKADEAVRRGVVTASTGNHAQSIAYAASLFGAKATIVVPHGISRVKVEALGDLGADVIFHAPSSKRLGSMLRGLLLRRACSTSTP